MKTARFTVAVSGLPWWGRVVWYFSRKRTLIYLPESWQDITGKQWRRTLRAHIHAMSLPAAAARLHLFGELCRVPAWLRGLIAAEDYVERLLPYTAWATQPPKHRHAPTIQAGWRTWIVPAEELQDMTVGQFLHCERLFRDAGTQPLAFLAAFLRIDDEHTRRYQQQGGYLPPHHEEQRQHHDAYLRLLPYEQVYYLVHYYAAQREWAAKKYPHLYDDPKKKKEPNTAPTPVQDWEALPAQIASTQVFGPVADVLATSARTYLAWANGRAAAQSDTKPGQSVQDIIRQHHQKIAHR